MDVRVIGGASGTGAPVIGACRIGGASENGTSGNDPEFDVGTPCRADAAFIAACGIGAPSGRGVRSCGGKPCDVGSAPVGSALSASDPSATDPSGSDPKVRIGSPFGIRAACGCGGGGGIGAPGGSDAAADGSMAGSSPVTRPGSTAGGVGGRSGRPCRWPSGNWPSGNCPGGDCPCGNPAAASTGGCSTGGKSLYRATFCLLRRSHSAIRASVSAGSVPGIQSSSTPVRGTSGPTSRTFGSWGNRWRISAPDKAVMTPRRDESRTAPVPLARS